MEFAAKQHPLWKYFFPVFLLFISGCYTTQALYVEADKLPTDKTYRINSAFLKNGKTIDLGIYEPRFEKFYKGKKNVLLYYDETYTERYIELKDISMLKIEIIEGTVVETILIVAGGVVLIAFIAFVIIMNNFKVH
jgi:hypothetical protein